MAKERINAKYYTVSKYYDDYDKRFSSEAYSKDGTLFSLGNYRTKITPSMLPEGKYAYVTLWYIPAFLRTTGISDMHYHQDIWTDNHFLKYDFLHVAYDGKKLKGQEKEIGMGLYNYDVILSDTEMLRFLGMVRKYGDFDVEPFINAIKEKDRICRERYGDVYPKYAGEPGTIDRILDVADEFNSERIAYWEKTLRGERQ